MKFKLALGLILTGLVAGCGGSNLSTEERAQQAEQKAKTDAAWETRESVTYKGNSFEVAENSTRTVAYVQAVQTNSTYTPSDVEQIAKNKTGCSGKMNAGVLAFIGGFGPDTDLRKVKDKSGKPFRWSVSLSC